MIKIWQKIFIINGLIVSDLNGYLFHIQIATAMNNLINQTTMKLKNPNTPRKNKMDYISIITKAIQWINVL